MQSSFRESYVKLFSKELCKVIFKRVVQSSFENGEKYASIVIILEHCIATYPESREEKCASEEEAL